MMMGTTVAGKYLAAKFAASAGDVKGAAAFYSETLKEDPENTDLLVRAFMFSAESGEMERAIALADRVIAKDPQNRPARLVRQAGAFMKKDYEAPKLRKAGTLSAVTALENSSRLIVKDE